VGLNHPFVLVIRSWNILENFGISAPKNAPSFIEKHKYVSGKTSKDEA